MNHNIFRFFFNHFFKDIDLTGFTPGETVLLYVEDESINEAGLDAVTADASGRVTYRGPVPTDLPDGKYRFHAWNITYGEEFISKPVQVKDGWWQVDGENIPVDPDKPAPTNEEIGRASCRERV